MDAQGAILIVQLSDSSHATHSLGCTVVVNEATSPTPRSLEADTVEVCNDPLRGERGPLSRAVADGAASLAGAAAEGIHGVAVLAGANATVRDAMFGGTAASPGVVSLCAATLLDAVSRRERDTVLTVSYVALRRDGSPPFDLLHGGLSEVVPFDDGGDEESDADAAKDSASLPLAPLRGVSLAGRHATIEAVEALLHRGSECFAAMEGGTSLRAPSTAAAHSARVVCLSLQQRATTPPVDLLAHLFIVEAAEWGENCAPASRGGSSGGGGSSSRRSISTPLINNDGSISSCSSYADSDAGSVIGAACGSSVLARLLSDAIGSNCVALVTLAMGYGDEREDGGWGSGCATDSSVLLTARRLRAAAPLCAPIVNNLTVRRLFAAQFRRLRSSRDAVATLAARLAAAVESYEAQLLAATQAALENQLEAAEASAWSAVGDVDLAAARDAMATAAHAEAARAAEDAASIRALEREVAALRGGVRPESAGLALTRRATSGREGEAPAAAVSASSSSSSYSSSSLSADSTSPGSGFSTSRGGRRDGGATGGDGSISGTSSASLSLTSWSARCASLLERCVDLRRLLGEVVGEPWPPRAPPLPTPLAPPVLGAAVIPSNAPAIVEGDAAAAQLEQEVLRTGDLEKLKVTLQPTWAREVPPPASLCDPQGRLLPYAKVAEKVLAAEALHGKMRALLTTASQHIKKLQLQQQQQQATVAAQK